MQVPFHDSQSQNALIWEEVEKDIQDIVTSGHFLLGPAVERFEQAFAQYLGVKHCIGVNNGTSALHLALVASDIGPGDEVITTPHSWVSSSWAISYVGAKPVFVDIDPFGFTLDAHLVEQAVTSRTRAILPVHLYGQAADMTAFRRIAGKYNLALIEDACQAPGAKHMEKYVGTFGDAGCFSFDPTKNLGAFGDAGAVVTNDDRLAERMRRLRDHAQWGRHQHREIGYSYHLGGIQGAVLNVKLSRLDGWNTKRRRLARQYRELLSGHPNIILRLAERREEHVWGVFVVLIRGVEREPLRKKLLESGIATSVHYPTPIPYQPAYESLGYRCGDFPIAEDVMKHCISLPMYPELTEEQVAYVASTLRRCLDTDSARSSEMPGRSTWAK